MKNIDDIIESVLRKGQKVIIETNDDEIDDWDPEEGIFHRLDEAKPVGPMKPMKPGETKDDVRAAADPNQADGENDPVKPEVRAAADADARDEENAAPENNKAVDKANDLVNSDEPLPDEEDGEKNKDFPNRT